MYELYELVRIIEDNLDLNQTDWECSIQQLTVREIELLDKVRSKTRQEEFLIAEQLGYQGEQDPNYRRYKRQIKNFLFELILRYSPEKKARTSFQKAYYRTQKLFGVFNILRGLGNSAMALRLAKQLVRTCKYYCFNEMIFELSRYLGRYYSNNELNIHQAHEYFNQAQEALELMDLEFKIEREYSEYITHFINNKSIKPIRGLEALNSLEQFVKPSDKSVESFKYHLYYYRLGTLAAEGAGDFRQALLFATKGYEYFQALHFDHRTAKIIFMSTMAQYYLKLRQLDQAKSIVTETLNLQEKGRTNWFISKKLLVQIEIHSKNYNSAFQNYLEIINHKSFNNIPEDIQGVIKLIGAYLDFLRLTDEINIGPVPTRFRINRFVNEVPRFSADKRGMRIPLIIAQLLYNIYDKDYDAVENRIFALKDYCSRNLMRKSENFRSNCFIKMLLLIPTNSFNPVAAKRKTNNLLRRLSEVPYELSSQSSEVEVIPYEDLWDIILKYLQAPKRRRKIKHDFTQK